MLWQIIYITELKKGLENMNTKRNFKIISVSADDKETKLWSGKCTGDELYEKFQAAIKVQMDKYRKNPERCQLRAYDDTGRIIAQETFHGVSENKE